MSGAALGNVKLPVRAGRNGAELKAARWGDNQGHRALGVGICPSIIAARNTAETVIVQFDDLRTECGSAADDLTGQLELAGGSGYQNLFRRPEPGRPYGLKDRKRKCSFHYILDAKGLCQSAAKTPESACFLSSGVRCSIA